MTNTLQSYIQQYTKLESGIQELVLEKCAPLCVQCSCICCDAVMCEEAIKSPFLKLVHQQTNLFNETKGFLSSTGCILKQGRPSVCYEYFCDNHFFDQPDDLHALLLQILGSLIFHATRQAKGNIPLDEVPENELDQLDFQGLEKQLNESFQALDIIRSFYCNGTLSNPNYALLKQIRIPEEFDTPPETSAR